MSILEHWHPVTSIRSLKKGPIGVKIDGQEIAVFRTQSGALGALADACPHRRMRLSLGRVQGEKLMCHYHGWTFDCEGQGESPGTPKMHACTKAYEVKQAHGYVWVREAGSETEFPQFDIDGFLYIGSTEHEAPAPLELTLDNFCEIEHTPTVHAVFGYELNKMHEVQVKFETTEKTVRVINHGPAKRINPILARLIGIRRGYEFWDDWTTHFSPVHSIYDHWWIDPQTGKESKVRWRVYIFFTPVEANLTRVTSFTFAKSRWPFGPAGGLRPFRWLMRKHLRREIGLDLNSLKGLASHNPSIEGMKLSRFDKALGLNRERIDRIYRKKSDTRQELTLISG